MDGIAAPLPAGRIGNYLGHEKDYRLSVSLENANEAFSLRRDYPMSLAGHAQTAIYFSSLHLNPVLLQIGPFALRWYSLAYIAGILLGWFYLIRLLAQDAAPMTREQADALVTWVTAGIIIGGRLAYVIFYDPEPISPSH